MTGPASPESDLAAVRARYRTLKVRALLYAAVGLTVLAAAAVGVAGSATGHGVNRLAAVGLVFAVAFCAWMMVPAWTMWLSPQTRRRKRTWADPGPPPG